MSVLPRVLLEASAVPTGVSTAYTAPPNTRTLVDKMTATNTSAGALALSVNMVPSGGTAGTGNRVMSGQTIAAGVTYLCPEVAGHILGPGGMIATDASAGGIVVRISGREVS